MSNVSESERELQQLDEAEAQRQRDAARRRELRQQVAVEKEQEARTRAARWLLDNVRALGGAASSLDETMEKLRKNLNRRDTESANAQWGRITERLELAEVVLRRFPGIKTPALPEIVPPGRRGLDTSDLIIATPKRQLFPVIVASDSPELRDALYARAAWQWLAGRGSALPEELRGAAAVEVPEPDLSARVAFQAAESVRQQQAAYQAARP